MKSFALKSAVSLIANSLPASVLVSTMVMGFSVGALAAAPKGQVYAGETKPFGNPSAPQGGTFTGNWKVEPSTLNPITGSDVPNGEIQTLVLDSLMDRDPNTYEWIPSLAEKAEISPDGKTFTFTLRKGVVWQDGKPLTSEDVKFSFDVIFDPKYGAAHLIPYFEGIEKAEIIDPLTVKFTAKEKYFGNFSTIAGMSIVPKHFYGNADEGKKKNKTILGSGPYKLEKYDQGQSITFVRNKDWWGNNVASKKGAYNFEHIRMRFIKDDNIEIETLKKGDLDYIELNPESYAKKTDGPLWGKTVQKVKTENSAPQTWGYIGWNMRRDLFKDREVRKALAMLTNRDEMIKKFRYGMSIPATGPWYQKSEYADPSVKAIAYNPAAARDILTKAGWVDSDKDGVLDKVINGKKTDFRFTVIYANPDTKKYWEMYQADLKKSGIVMDIQQLDWNALLKSVDENKFDAVALAWGAGSVDLDPKQIWHSSSIGRGGSNFVGYSNPEVDKLIDQARAELDKKKRIVILRKVYRTIAEDAPYDFLFNEKYVLYANTSRTHMTKPTFKFDLGKSYWWAVDK